MFKMKRWFLFMAIALTSWTLLGAVKAQDGIGKMPPARVYALVFKADWCSNCRVLAPKVMKVLPEFIPRGVVPVELDMTSDGTAAKARDTAGKLGVKKLVEGNDGTGFIVLVDAGQKTKIGKITANLTEDEMKTAFDKALAKASSQK